MTDKNTNPCGYYHTGGSVTPAKEQPVRKKKSSSKKSRQQSVHDQSSKKRQSIYEDPSSKKSKQSIHNNPSVIKSTQQSIHNDPSSRRKSTRQSIHYDPSFRRKSTQQSFQESQHKRASVYCSFESFKRPAEQTSSLPMQSTVSKRQLSLKASRAQFLYRGNVSLAQIGSFRVIDYTKDSIDFEDEDEMFRATKSGRLGMCESFVTPLESQLPCAQAIAIATVFEDTVDKVS